MAITENKEWDTDSIPVAKNYREHIYFVNVVFELGEPALLGSKRISYEYACVLRYLLHMKNGINNFRKKHPGSIVIFKMVNDSWLAWKENQSITLFQCFFHITNGIIIFCWCIILGMRVVTEDI